MFSLMHMSDDYREVPVFAKKLSDLFFIPLQFQSIADQLFQSFNSSISVTSFDTLSSCIISWLEEYCKPQVLEIRIMTAVKIRFCK